MHFEIESARCCKQPNRIGRDYLDWYRNRSEVSENGIKELKIGFVMERMPCGQFKANAAFFRIGVIAHNLFVLFKHSVLGGDWQRYRVVTVRWRLFYLPGKVVRHARKLVL
ncbi:MAG: transposase [Nitrosomonas sp.]|nr:transposase [Nitrosomonas sp.]